MSSNCQTEYTMERKSDFYVTLSSNASTDCYPQNVVGHFWNRMAEPLQFTDGREWEVGLTEISLPPHRLSQMIEQEEWEMRVFTRKPPPHPGRGGSMTYNRVMALKPFSYASDLKKQFNCLLGDNDAEAFNRVDFDAPYGKKSLRIRLPKKVKLALSERLVDVMGINRKELNDDGSLGSFSKPTTFYGTIDWAVGSHSLWVYSNCCAHRPVGDVGVPLLRTLLTVSKDEGVMFKKLFNLPYYLAVSQSFFNSLEVFITNNQGQQVPFFPGEGLVTLHFRPRERRG